MRLNHPETVPLHCLWKYYFPWNRFLVPKRLGTAFLVDSLERNLIGLSLVRFPSRCDVKGGQIYRHGHRGLPTPLSTSLVGAVDYCKDRI